MPRRPTSPLRGQGAALEDAKARFLGKSGRITELLKALGSLADRAEEAPARRRDQPAPRPRIEAALAAAPRRSWRKAELDRQLQAEALDVTLPGRQPRRRRQPAPHQPRRSSASKRSSAQHGFRGRRRPRDRDRLDELHGVEQPREPSGAVDAGHVLRRRAGRPRPLAQPAPAHQPDAGAVCTRACTCPCTRAMPRAMRDAACGGDARDPRHRARAVPTASTATPRTRPMFHQCEGLWIGESRSASRT